MDRAIASGSLLLFVILSLCSGCSTEKRIKAAEDAIRRTGARLIYDEDNQVISIRLDRTTRETFGDAELAELMESLKVFPKLDRLWLANTRITDKGVAMLKELRGLKHLSLGNTSVTDTGVEHLRQLPNLANLRLDGTKVTNTSVRHLSDVENLWLLSLSATQVDDEVIPALSELDSLEELFIVDTRITPAGLEQLKSVLPNTRISYTDDDLPNELR